MKIKGSWLRVFILFMIATISAKHTSAASLEAEEKIKAKFITNYIHYTKWPQRIRKDNDPLVICIIEGDLTASYLRKMNGGGKNKVSMIIKEKNKKDNLLECNVLFINKDVTDDKYYYINNTKGKPILTISDIPDFAKHGGITSFQFIPGKDVELELNMPALKASKIDIHSDLLSIMTIIK